MTDLDVDDEDKAADSGVKVVGAPETAPPPALPTKASERARRAAAPRRKGNGINLGLAVVAALAVIAAAVFGILWADKGTSLGTQQDPAVTSAANKFLTDFFNFNAKSIDTDFNAITAMATGQFATQANQFFNSAIRSELEKALAETRGQVRLLEVQSENDAQTTASVYAVVDEVYVNNKINTPQSDVVRLVVGLQKVGSVWKISDVNVLEGPNPASAGSASGSAGSSVPGQ